ncbi:hypothetical protein R3P38DRAFT_2933685 [Favolaschia claudopus]|uniref:Uncharacterized protein n=1 Tax=Favolaschia claudopus TaxID=2862362 RepID=A0AAW0BVX0_9AGAR
MHLPSLHTLWAFLLGATLTRASPQIATLKGLTQEQLSETTINLGHTEISAIGTDAQGGTTYVEVAEYTSLIAILPSLTLTVLSTPTAFTETFVEDASHFSGAIAFFPGGMRPQTAIEECNFGADSLGTCALRIGDATGPNGESAVVTESGTVVPITTLTAPGLQSTSIAQSPSGSGQSGVNASPTASRGEIGVRTPQLGRMGGVILCLAMFL